MATRSGNRSKHKRSVPTTLGKAPPNSNSDCIDLSHLRRPIDTSIFGLSQILSLFETATDEVRRYITYECELMFECRICRTIFRSLANFILHKRNYCQDLFSSLSTINKTDLENNEFTIIDKDNLLSSPNGKFTDIETAERRYPKRNLSLVLKKLSDKQDSQKIVEDVMNEELSEGGYLEEINESTSSKTICLESIDNNKEGVFQTIDCKQIGNDLMKSEVMEIHSILNNNEAILGPDGKVFSFKTEINRTAGQKLICTICNLKFSTKKTLTHHIKYKHNETRVVYICPECKDSFANAWCVFRHLYKIHRKTTAQIRRMRDQVHSSAIIKKQENINKKTLAIVDRRISGDSQSNDFYQDVDSQFCLGCGKKFERKAALNTHIQTCLKRVASNNPAKEKSKDNQEVVNKQLCDIAKGSSRRKPKILQRITKDENLGIAQNEEISCGNEQVHTDDTNSGKQTIECRNSSSDGKDVSCTEENTNTNENITGIKDTDYQKQLIQEIIFGSGATVTNDGLSKTSCTKNYIGLVSDEEEILGFVRENDVLIKDNVVEKNVENIEQSISLMDKIDKDKDCTYLVDDVNENIVEEVIEIDKTKTYIPKSDTIVIENSKNCENEEINMFDFQEDISAQDIVLDNYNDKFSKVQDLMNEKSNEAQVINLVNDKEYNVSNQSSNENLNRFPKISILRQYGSKKTKTDNLAKSFSNEQVYLYISNELNEEEITETNMNINNNVDTTHIDLPSEIQGTDITVAAQYDVSEIIDISDSEESDTCSCFDDKSNDSLNSCGSNKGSDENLNKNESKFNKPFNNSNTGIEIDEDITGESLGNKRVCRKRKSSSDIQADNISDSTLLEKCNDYVDWNKVLCQPCSKSFLKQTDLLKHMALHFNWLQYECSICSFMSYDKNACRQHIYKHDIHVDLVNDFIHPLPHLKTLCMATPFSKVIEGQSEDLENVCDNKDNETNEDNMSLTCSANKIKTQDPLLRKMIMEVIFGSEESAVKETSESSINKRPIRNRISVKSLQKDFEYDMRQIEAKAKKPTIDNKVKPIKIVKNNETNFRIVNSPISQDNHKKKRTY